MDCPLLHEQETSVAKECGTKQKRGLAITRGPVIDQGETLLKGNKEAKLRKGEGIVKCFHFGKNGSGVLCLWRIADQVCLRQKDLIWHPRVVWKFSQARLG